MSHHVVAKGTTRDHDQYHRPLHPNVHGWLPLGQIFHLTVDQF